MRKQSRTAGSLAGLTAVVTGGSRGLGLLIGGELAARGCAVTIAARDADELSRAADLLEERGQGSVRTAVCDVRERDEVEALFTSTAQACGGVDIVVANAGVIEVAPVDAIGADEFDEAMGTMFGGALHTSLAALPHLRRSPAGGRLALIGSIGGLLAVPHLLPYSCAKYAVAALAEGLHTEEAQRGVSVTAVHPGLMRTGSHGQAEFGGDARREFAWFSALAGTPLVSMDAERAASRIVAAVARRRPRIVLTPAGKAADLLHGIAPVTVTRLSGIAARALPDADGAEGGLRKGRDITERPRGVGERLRAWGSALNDRAAVRLNQHAPKTRP
ncbi:SDR family NAD(P)-dependent oxidoreductase [Streptomyces sp. NBC_01190]|uniref:SDR family NAD(P)-dependent oxidoreductase n=1 Tax=Streptomyces sp. NBC_01190 TaxID=2903767 RepID=UPI0038672064|nr:SDR family oxidoreductase [Streptomyces sp. NBC_01190]